MMDGATQESSETTHIIGLAFRLGVNLRVAYTAYHFLNVDQRGAGRKRHN